TAALHRFRPVVVSMTVRLLLVSITAIVSPSSSKNCGLPVVAGKPFQSRRYPSLACGEVGRASTSGTAMRSSESVSWDDLHPRESASGAAAANIVIARNTFMGQTPERVRGWGALYRRPAGVVFAVRRVCSGHVHGA